MRYIWHIMTYKFKQTNASDSVLILDEAFCSQSNSANLAYIGH
jgi:hypothetical protein